MLVTDQKKDEFYILIHSTLLILNNKYFLCSEAAMLLIKFSPESLMKAINCKCTVSINNLYCGACAEWMGLTYFIVISIENGVNLLYCNIHTEWG